MAEVVLVVEQIQLAVGHIQLAVGYTLAVHNPGAASVDMDYKDQIVLPWEDYYHCM